MTGSSESGTGDQAGDAPASAGPEHAAEPGGENATVRAAVVTGTLLALAALLVLYGLVQVWPPAPPPPLAGGATTPTAGPTVAPTTTTPAGEATTTTIVVQQAAPNPPIRLFGATLEVDREARLFIVVALAGALGALVYALRSLSWYAGNRNLKYSWMMTYYLQPIVGAGLATITYVVLRGGLVLVTTQSSPDAVNPFGFAAFGALVGMFSAQAAEWLKRVFEQVFTLALKGKDAAIEIRITEVVPKLGPSGTEVVITGTGLADVQTVTFGGVEASEVRTVSDTELRVTVPEGAASGPIVVRTPAGTVGSPQPFTVGAAGEQQPTPQGQDEEPVDGELGPPQPDPDEHLEAGLTGLSSEQVITLAAQATAEHGEPQEVEVEDEPLDEDALLPDEPEEGEQR